MRLPGVAGVGDAVNEWPARRVELRGGAPEDLGVDLLALPAFEAAAGGVTVAEDLRSLADRLTGGTFSRLAERGGIRGGEGEMRLLSAVEPGLPDLLVVGTGERDPSPEAARRAAGAAVRAARRARAGSVAFAAPTGAADEEAATWQAAAEGLVLGDWEYGELRGPAERKKRGAPPELAVLYRADAPAAEGAVARAVEAGRIVAEAQNTARELVARPANVATPRFLAEAAGELAGREGLRAEAWGPARLAEEGFGALLAVSRGSAEEPRFVILEHEGSGGPVTCLVGKGVTFDSGGISLKSSEGMERMKYDMAGAAAVLGVLEAAARLRLPRRIVGLLACTENLPSGSALKPGDVIRGVTGRSIEVVNTDAEGRLVLSDALAFAARLKPRAIVDLATLTGGCVVALGRHAIGMMATSDEIADGLERAGERTGERVWRLPLWREYRRQLDSDVADIKNSGGREASPITAGWFLREFVGEVPWAHLDIAGSAWSDEERFHQPKGATGVGVRLLVEWLRDASSPE